MTLSAEMGTLLVISQVRTVDARFVHHDGSDLKTLVRDAAKEFVAYCVAAVREFELRVDVQVDLRLPNDLVRSARNSTIAERYHGYHEVLNRATHKLEAGAPAFVYEYQHCGRKK